MALISTVRKNSGTAVGLLVGILILLMLGGDILRFGIGSASQRRTDVGKIAGYKIDVREYQTHIDQLRYRLSITTAESFIQEQAWRQLIAEYVYRKECDDLGLQVSPEELIDMVQGDHVHPDLQMSFSNPVTQEFDRGRLIAHLQSLSQAPAEQQRQWRDLEYRLAVSRKHEKLSQLMRQSAFVNSLEARAQHKAANTTLHVNCLYIPYHAYSEESIQADPAKLAQYLAENKDAYQTEQRRGVQYLVFPVEPIAEDQKSFQEELEALKEAFAQAKDARIFAKVNTDNQPDASYLYLTPQELPDVLKAQKRRAAPVVGPVQEGSWHRLYRIVKSPTTEDEVYEVAVIDKKLVPGDNACDQVFRQADLCASTVRDSTQLAEYAAQQDMPVHTAAVSPNDIQVGTLPQARTLVRWLYNEAKVGTVSSPFELGEAYVVAIMTGHTLAGTAPLDQVREEIASRVINAYKASKIIAKLQEAAPSLTLAEQAAQHGHGARFVTIDNLCFDDDSLQVTGTARRAVGAAAALQPGAQTAVADEHGVVVIELLSRDSPVPPEDITTQQGEMTQFSKLKQSDATLQSLEELGKIQDYRYRFY